MHYVPDQELKELPNIIVDGSGNQHSVLVLSHWPHSGSSLPLLGILLIEISPRTQSSQPNAG